MVEGTPADPLQDESIWGIDHALIGPALPDAEAFSTQPLISVLRDAAAHRPDAIALVGKTSRLCFAELYRLALSAARAVVAVVPPGRPIACLLPATPEAIAGLLGCLISGRLCLVLDQSHPAERLAAMLEDGDAAALFVTEPPPFAFAGPVIDLADALAGEVADRAPDEYRNPDDPLAVYYTSGSSGRPKGIVLSRRYLMYRALEAAECWGLGPADCILPATGHASAFGVAALIATIARGARMLTLTIATDGAGASLRLIEREGLTCADIPAPLLRLLFAVGRSKVALGTLRSLRIGATGLTRSDLTSWRKLLPATCVIWHTYASTEAFTIASWAVPLDDPDDAPLIAAGAIKPFHEYALVDRDNRRVRAGEAGELVLRSCLIALGEWQAGRLVPGRLPSVPGRPGWRYYRTGDILFVQPNGLLRMLGRADRQIKINGVRIEPAEVEAVLMAEPGVTDAVVVADGPLGETSLHGFVAATPADREALTSALRTRLREALPASMRPTKLTVLDRLPALPTGKTDVSALMRGLTPGGRSGGRDSR
jgi:acyl-coenzyme A synthetase/AMP-(fatty) acid ligase